MNTIGTCSECGGPVKLPAFMVNPVPTCAKCGAVAKNPYGRVVPMQPKKSRGETERA